MTYVRLPLDVDVASRTPKNHPERFGPVVDVEDRLADFEAQIASLAAPRERENVAALKQGDIVAGPHGDPIEVRDLSPFTTEDMYHRVRRDVHGFDEEGRLVTVPMRVDVPIRLLSA